MRVDPSSVIEDHPRHCLSLWPSAPSPLLYWGAAILMPVSIKTNPAIGFHSTACTNTLTGVDGLISNNQ